MPNWICNKLSTDKDIEKVVEVTKSDTGYMDFNSIVLIPDNIYQGDIGSKEKELYGKNNWYDWSIANWGCKWNASNDDFICVEENTIYFDTPWSGVPELMYKLSQRFPNLEFTYKFADEDFGWNTGYFKFKNGEVLLAEFNNGNYGAIKTAFELWGNCCKYFILVNRQGDAKVLFCPVERI